MTKSVNHELLTAEELAKRVRICPDTVRLWGRRGLIPRIQLSPKVIRYDLQAVIDNLRHRHGRKGGNDG